MKPFQVGDWVRGKTNYGELFHGYIHSDEPFSQNMKVRVIKSDNEEMEGKVISANSIKMRRLETSATYSKDSILALIDIALLIKDKEWFMELTSLLTKPTKLEAQMINKSPFNLIEKRQNI
ncbi:IDEAL domain-containing protein [Robertmurraya sp. GLU-23]